MVTWNRNDIPSDIVDINRTRQGGITIEDEDLIDVDSIMSDGDNNVVMFDDDIDGIFSNGDSDARMSDGDSDVSV
ncbi:hypothetical protein BVC80_8129g3 [Macleaya cordata]|uniref:Uncharacterized protein n=1 Tax=Macleaya cordata TaxID=56857 RepID=A0A200QQP8_MACCD|nr:hypothetical protein BVC80_8129g3 [Macleaya cordata]